uniref:Endothelin-like toxin domain-containing protein n=1 Tax=Neolamprologus brichardi TaxID=32507 RepID=A0A3Q4G0L6_NEOBR
LDVLKILLFITSFSYQIADEHLGNDSLGLPVMNQVEVEVQERVPTHRLRTKRCACSNPLDSECHYFCHLDIIWINTPSKTTVYGLGGAFSRRRRSTGRCTCANRDDQPSSKPQCKALD